MLYVPSRSVYAADRLPCQLGGVGIAKFDSDGTEEAAIFKVNLDGCVVDRFGSAGKMPKARGEANSSDRPDPNELLIGEMTNWRVRRVMLTS